VDLVCGMDVEPGEVVGGSVEYVGVMYWFCCPGCCEKFVVEF